MKPSTAILYTMVTLSFVFSLTALIIVAGNNDFFASTSQSTLPTPTQSTNTKPATTTQTPTPTPTPSDSELTISYTVAKTQELDIGEYGRTKITLSTKIVYQGKDEITIYYSQFYLQLSAPGRWIGYPPQSAGKVYPENSGTVTLGALHTTTVIQLDFDFPNAIYEDPYAKTVSYGLSYNGTAKIIQ